MECMCVCGESKKQVLGTAACPSVEGIMSRCCVRSSVFRGHRVIIGHAVPALGGEVETETHMNTALGRELARSRCRRRLAALRSSSILLWDDDIPKRRISYPSRDMTKPQARETKTS